MFKTTVTSGSGVNVKTKNTIELNSQCLTVFTYKTAVVSYTLLILLVGWDFFVFVISFLMQLDPITVQQQKTNIFENSVISLKI